MLPFTDTALTGPLDVTASTCPLTLAATSGADAPSTRTLPLTVVAPSRTPRGSRTVKSTTTSFPCADPCRKTVPSPPPPPPPPPGPPPPPPPLPTPPIATPPSEGTLTNATRTGIDPPQGFAPHTLERVALEGVARNTHVGGPPQAPLAAR